MPMLRRKITDAMLKFRETIEAKLGTIPALSDSARKLLTAQGFLDYFLEIRGFYPTYEDAYEMLETQHERITGRRMYSEYHSFRAVYKRWLKRQKKESRSSP